MKAPLSSFWAPPSTVAGENLPAPWVWFYSLWVGEQCEYVGKTTDLRKRLSEHRARWLKKELPVRDCEVRVLLGQDEERRLIMELEPNMNLIR